jgi:hypothetical protein
MAPNGTECGELFVCWSSGPKKHLGRRVQMLRAGRARARGTAAHEEVVRERAQGEQGSGIALPPARSAGSASSGLRPSEAGSVARGSSRGGAERPPSIGALSVRARSDSSPGAGRRSLRRVPDSRGPLQRSGMGGVPFWPGSSPSGAVGRSCCRMPGCRRMLRHSQFENASRKAGTERESGIPARTWKAPGTQQRPFSVFRGPGKGLCGGSAAS